MKGKVDEIGSQQHAATDRTCANFRGVCGVISICTFADTNAGIESTRAREPNTLRRFGAGAARGTPGVAGNTRALDCQGEVGGASADTHTCKTMMAVLPLKQYAGTAPAQSNESR